MQAIAIGQQISALRRAKGITQGELAAHLGVSKPAVSKWETGQSYPDIILLPQIAAYFGVTVDALLQYSPQLSLEEIREIYGTLARRFAEEPFPQVASACREEIKRYYSCYRLVFMMGGLLLNNLALAGAEAPAVLEGLLPLFSRVERESGDGVLARQASYMQAACYLSLNRPDAAIAILERGEEAPPLASAMMLAQAYQMKGEWDRARELAQAELYQHVMGIIGCGRGLLTLYAQQPAKMEAFYTSIHQATEAFGLQQMHPFSCLPFYAAAAKCYITAGQEEKALEALERYTDLACGQGAAPLKLRGSSLFDGLNSLFEGLDLGKSAPRSVKLILQDCCKIIRDDADFQPLSENPRFQLLVKRLQALQSGNAMD